MPAGSTRIESKCTQVARGEVELLAGHPAPQREQSESDSSGRSKAPAPVERAPSNGQETPNDL